ncbi:hypothetical protein ACIQVO_36655 [Streptomyces sp. NPDC101062]|uniref:hypothetical protein n=1 Tax=unclassified Streptomyces TaxID=2593676 RepID=UPI0038008EA5
MADDRLVPTRRIAAVDLWGPGQEGRRPEAGQQARIMACVDGVDDAWSLAAVCRAERGGELIAGLLSAVAAAEASPVHVAFVYGLYFGGELSRWTHGRTIPLTDPRVPELHGICDEPGSGLTRLC